MNQEGIIVKCVTPDKEHTITAWREYEVRDIFRQGNEILITCDYGYIRWFPLSLFNCNSIEELLKDVNN